MLDPITSLNVSIAVLTRRRPEMLQNLLVSWSKISMPEQVEVRFLVVENDDASRSEEMVKSCAPLFNDGPLCYVLETSLGIPFGRNRAARDAIENGSDLLIFVDDDEEVAQDWLDRLISGYRASDARLLGAPLRAKAPQAELSTAQHLMLRCIMRRYRQKEDRAAKRATLNATPRVTIVTNNWLGEASLFSKDDIWFDEAMRFTGGTDSKFYADAKRKGIATGWVADAFVYETVPTSRLSFLYQFRRGRDQSNTNFHRKIASNPLLRASVLVSVPMRCLSVLLLIAAMPFTRGETALDIARSIGWIAGRIGALFGFRSELYRKTTGQ